MRREKLAAILAGSLSLVGVMGSPGRATPGPAPPASGASSDGAFPAPDGDTKAARRAHLAGLEARQRGDFPAALAFFAEAWSHKHHWEIAVNLGEAEMETGRYREALLHLTFALEERGFLDRSPDLVAEERARIDGWLAEARAQLARASGAAASAAPTASAPAATSASGAPTSASPTDAPLSSAWMITVGAGSGAAVLGILAATLMHGMATAQIGGVRSSLASLPGEAGDPASIRCAGEAAQAVCDANAGRLREADALQTAGNLTLLAAGAVAAGTLVLALVGPRRAAPGGEGAARASTGATSVRLAVAPARDGAAVGLYLSGAF